jgi:hypothetical protein
MKEGVINKKTPRLSKELCFNWEKVAMVGRITKEEQSNEWASYKVELTVKQEDLAGYYWQFRVSGEEDCGPDILATGGDLSAGYAKGDLVSLTKDNSEYVRLLSVRPDTPGGNLAKEDHPLARIATKTIHRPDTQVPVQGELSDRPDRDTRRTGQYGTSVNRNMFTLDRIMPNPCYRITY